MNNILDLLKNIGFSNLESSTYLALVQERKATGYKIAKIIGKPVSNTYKALVTLQKKGAIIIDESKNPNECMPIPVEDYLKRLENNLKNNSIQIKEQLKNYTTKLKYEGIFQITNINQVIEKGIEIINSAKQLILLDSFPHPLSIFKESLEKKAMDGVKVIVKAYESVELKRCNIVNPPSKVRSVDWNFDWFNITVDDSGFLFAMLDKQNHGVIRAIWSKDIYLNMVVFNGLTHEFILSQISNSILAEKPSNELILELKQLYQDYLYDIPIVENFKNLFL